MNNAAVNAGRHLSKEPQSEEAAEPPSADLEADVDAVIEACGGERAAIRALLIANEFLTSELDRSRSTISVGYVRKGQRSAIE